MQLKCEDTMDFTWNVSPVAEAIKATGQAVAAKIRALPAEHVP